MTEKVGTVVVADPKQEPNWITPDVAEGLFKKYVGKNFVKTGDDKDAKKFFYRVMSLNGYEPAGFLAPAQGCLVQLMVQKFYRHKQRKVTKRDEQQNQVEVDEPEAVQGTGWTKDGIAYLIDPTASFGIDMEKFKAEFKPDTE